VEEEEPLCLVFRQLGLNKGPEGEGLGGSQACRDLESK
jgi:hypothetical protein